MRLGSAGYSECDGVFDGAQKFSNSFCKNYGWFGRGEMSSKNFKNLVLETSTANKYSAIGFKSFTNCSFRAAEQKQKNK
jgi:hypothetical protein